MADFRVPDKIFERVMMRKRKRKKKKQKTASKKQTASLKKINEQPLKKKQPVTPPTVIQNPKTEPSIDDIIDLTGKKTDIIPRKKTIETVKIPKLKELKTFLERLGFQYQPVPGDGHCFYSSILQSLKNNNVPIFLGDLNYLNKPLEEKLKDLEVSDKEKRKRIDGVKFRIFLQQMLSTDYVKKQLKKYEEYDSWVQEVQKFTLDNLESCLRVDKKFWSSLDLIKLILAIFRGNIKNAYCYERRNTFGAGNVWLKYSLNEDKKSFKKQYVFNVKKEFGESDEIEKEGNIFFVFTGDHFDSLLPMKEKITLKVMPGRSEAETSTAYKLTTKFYDLKL
jgi:hypothetical protein